MITSGRPCLRIAFLRNLSAAFLSRVFVNETFQHFPFVINCTPQIVGLAVDLHEDFVQVPFPIGVIPDLLDATFADIGGEYRTKSVPPEPHGFMRNVDPCERG